MKNRLLLLLVCFLLTGLVSCNSAIQNTDEKREWTDDLGRKVLIKTEVKRIVSLTPSVTELIGLICRQNQLVGRTQHCNYPAWVSSVQTLNVYPLDLEAVLCSTNKLILSAY